MRLALLVLVLTTPAFADEMPSISLREAITRALRFHPRDAEVIANVERARAHFENARAESLPSLVFRYEHVWEDSHTWGPDAVHVPLDLNQVALISRVPIVSPHAWSEWAEEKERVEVSEADAAASRRALGLTAARAWIEVATVAHALDVEQQGLRTAQDHAAFVGARLETGATSSLEVVRAEKEVAVASALVERARASLTRAQEVLGLVTGAPGAVDVDRADDHPLSDAAPSQDEPVADVVAAERALHAARTELRDLYTQYLPTLHADLLGFYEDHPQPELPVTGVGYAAFLRVTLPLYDGGAREANGHKRRAEVARAQAHLDDVTRTIAVERRNGMTDVVRLRASFDRTVDAARLSRSALELTEARYAAGKGTQLDVIYALRESRDADIAVAAAEDAWRRASLDLLAARGLVPDASSLRDYRR